MTSNTRISAVLAAVVFLAGSSSFAQSAGEAIYKAKCLMCHGANGGADTGMGKATKSLPVSDPSVKALTEEEMFTITRSGKLRMQPFKDKLSDHEIREVVAYFRTLK
jgi:mono/diheme cytochrome c family protein